MARTARWGSAEQVRSGGPGQNGSDSSGGPSIEATTLKPLDGIVFRRPRIHLYTTPEAVIAKMALPGIKPEDVDITIGDDLVTISGSFEEEKETIQCRLRPQGTEPRRVQPELLDPHGGQARRGDGCLQGRRAHLDAAQSEAVKPKKVKIEAV
jgi:HSP20 family protein